MLDNILATSNFEPADPVDPVTTLFLNLDRVIAPLVSIPSEESSLTQMLPKKSLSTDALPSEPTTEKLVSKQPLFTLNTIPTVSIDFIIKFRLPHDLTADGPKVIYGVGVTFVGDLVCASIPSINIPCLARGVDTVEVVERGVDIHRTGAPLAVRVTLCLTPIDPSPIELTPVIEYSDGTGKAFVTALPPISLNLEDLFLPALVPVRFGQIGGTALVLFEQLWADLQKSVRTPGLISGPPDGMETVITCYICLYVSYIYIYHIYIISYIIYISYIYIIYHI